MVDPTLLLDNEYITLSYLPDKKTVYHVVHQPIGGQRLREALLMGLQALQDHGAHKWLSDDRNNGPMSDEDREWGDININRRAQEMGWKYWALVVPYALAAAGSMSPIIEAAYPLGLRMMVFTDVEDAMKWLDEFED